MAGIVSEHLESGPVVADLEAQHAVDLGDVHRGARIVASVFAGVLERLECAEVHGRLDVVSVSSDPVEFDSGRQFAAWIGLVPGQYSSGGKARLGRITKAGDPYLRSLLVLGARAVLNAAQNRTDSLSRWAMALWQRRGYWKAVVAIAAKNARMAWAVLNKGEAFKLPA